MLPSDSACVRSYGPQASVSRRLAISCPFFRLRSYHAVYNRPDFDFGVTHEARAFDLPRAGDGERVRKTAEVKLRDAPDLHRGRVVRGLPGRRRVSRRAGVFLRDA